MSEFQKFGKIARLTRNCVVTEKIDGTNGQVFISEDGNDIRFGSRTRWLSPESDNFGFWEWCNDHTDALLALGPGRHFGEWWGVGIQRGYGLSERRFSLFNTGRWFDINETVGVTGIDGAPAAPAPACCHVVPVLYRGEFNTARIEDCLSALRCNGSAAAPGFVMAEGVVVFHEVSGHLYKKTCDHDVEPKGAHVKKERTAQMKKPYNPNFGGRRKGTGSEYTGFERRCLPPQEGAPA